MHDAPLSLLPAQPLKLIFTLLHITAALLLVYYFGILFFPVLSFVRSQNLKAEVKSLHKAYRAPDPATSTNHILLQAHQV